MMKQFIGQKLLGEAGRHWIICIDEIGPAQRGVDPDDRIDNNQDTVRAEVLWGNLMAGGGGAEWYFGYKNHNNDLGCEDWRSRDRMWDYTRLAIEFFQDRVPFWEMMPMDELVNEDAYCLAKQNEVYLVYIPYGKETSLNLENANGSYSIQWYNPHNEGELVQSELKKLQGGSLVEIGPPPQDTDQDWAILIKRSK